MAQLRTALSILVIVAVESAFGQVVMVSPMMAGMRRNPSQGHQMRVVRPMFQQAPIISRPVYTIAEAPVETEPEEPIDEQRLHSRIKELEIQKQDIAQKQMELDEKIAVLEEQVISCHKQISEGEAVLRKLDEVERLNCAEQTRLERLIEQQRLLEYKERIEQERVARQREALEEWSKKQRQKEENAEMARTEEQVTNCSKDKHHIDSGPTSSKPITQQARESNSEVQIQRPMPRFQTIHKHDQPCHSSSLHVHRISKNPDIIPGASTNSERAQIVKREGVMGPVSTTGNSTTHQKFERKTVGYEGVEKK